MENIETDSLALENVSTDNLESLFSKVMKEMRRRDSKYMAGDVITKSQTLRMLRSTSKLPSDRG